jgi:hypothetical protein
MAKKIAEQKRRDLAPLERKSPPFAQTAKGGAPSSTARTAINPRSLYCRRYKFLLTFHFVYAYSPGSPSTPPPRQSASPKQASVCYCAPQDFLLPTTGCKLPTKASLTPAARGTNSASPSSLNTRKLPASLPIPRSPSPFQSCPCLSTRLD